VSRVCGLAIIDVTDGVAEHEESIVNEQVSDVNYTKSLWVILGELDLCAAPTALSSRH